MSITIAPNSWPGFSGLYYLDTFFDYIINDHAYDGYNLVQRSAAVDIDEILTDWDLVPPFNVDTHGSQILVLNMGDIYMFYQQQYNGQFVELIPRQSNVEISSRINSNILKIPLPNGQLVLETFAFQELPLREIDELLMERIENEVDGIIPNNFDQILALLNAPELPESARLSETLSQSRYIQPAQVTQVNENTLMRESYETLIKQLYGLPVDLPQYLIINGSRVNFVPFEKIGPSFWSKTKMRAFQEPNRTLHY